MSPNLFKNDSPSAGPASSADSPRSGAKDGSTDRSRRKNRSNGVVSVFGPGLVVEGQVKSEGDLTIEGRLVGDLSVEGQVSVAAQGMVEGELAAQRVVVAGRVEGTILASESARLISGARVEADVTSPRLELEDGATLDGRISMRDASSGGAAATTHSRKTDTGGSAQGGADISGESASRSQKKTSKRDVA